MYTFKRTSIKKNKGSFFNLDQRFPSISLYIFAYNFESYLSLQPTVFFACFIHLWDSVLCFQPYFYVWIKAGGVRANGLNALSWVLVVYLVFMYVFSDKRGAGGWFYLISRWIFNHTSYPFNHCFRVCTYMSHTAVATYRAEHDYPSGDHASFWEGSCCLVFSFLRFVLCTIVCLFVVLFYFYQWRCQFSFDLWVQMSLGIFRLFYTM